jgi:hypothetical protein
MTITLPLSLGSNPNCSLRPSATPVPPPPSALPVPQKISSDAKGRFPPRLFRKTHSMPVHRALPATSSQAGLPADSQDLLVPTLKRKLGVRSKTFEDLPSGPASPASGRVNDQGGSTDNLYGFGEIPDDVRYGLARTAQAVRRARRVIIVCGKPFHILSRRLQPAGF